MAIATMGSDDAVAQEWIDHRDPNRPFRNVQKMTLDAMNKLGVPDPEKHARRNYVTYRQLRMPKHLNPLFQRERGYEIQGTIILVHSGPDASEMAIRIGQFALEKAAGFAFVAAALFVKDHFGEIKVRDFFEQLRKI